MPAPRPFAALPQRVDGVAPEDPRPLALRLWQAWRLRTRRRYLIARGLRRSRLQLRPVADRTALLRPGMIRLFATLRNEALRLPHFLDHYRRLGVGHFLIVDNASTDGSTDWLARQPDVSVWTTAHGYKQSRFGMDWMNGLLLRHGSGNWCLTVDADELLIYPHWETRPLPALTDWLDDRGIPAMGAMMLDLYPRGPLDAATHVPGQDPTQVLPWFDAGNYVMRRKADLGNLWIQGGPRARAFFAADPRRAPTLGKVPLVKWHWRYAYVSSTHTLLPPRLNRTQAEDGGEALSGILLHTKFLPVIVSKSAEEKQRRQHFANSSLYDAYYDAVAAAPDLWCAQSTRYQGWRHLEGLGLMSRGGWA
jgi:glycosyltransferase involved in cell wall biosynthesis